MKSAIVYTLELPQINNLLANLGGHLFKPCAPMSAQSAGFVPPEEHGPLAEQLGEEFTVIAIRIQKKAVPKSAIDEWVKYQSGLILTQTGREPGRREKRDMKAQAMAELLPYAIPNSRDVRALYDHATQRLLIDTTSQATADIFTSALVGACESVKSTTIHVSNIRHGLTKRVLDMVNGEDSFGDGIGPGGRLVIDTEDGRKQTLKSSLYQIEDQVREAIHKGYGVQEIELCEVSNNNETHWFTINRDFRFKAMTFESITDEVIDWRSSLMFAGLVMRERINRLVELLSYEAPANAAAELEAA